MVKKRKGLAVLGGERERRGEREREGEANLSLRRGFQFRTLRQNRCNYELRVLGMCAA